MALLEETAIAAVVGDDGVNEDDGDDDDEGLRRLLRGIERARTKRTMVIVRRMLRTARASYIMHTLRCI